MSCVLCKKDSFETVSEVDAKSSERLVVSICTHCGLVQQTPIPPTDELKIYYSHNYRADYKKTYSPKPKHVYRAAKIAIHRINFLHKHSVTAGTLIDVGAGGGEFVYLSGKMGFDSKGIEPNIGYSEYAKNEYGCTIETGEIENMNGQSDVITMFHVLEHLASPLVAMEKLYHSLNKHGVLFIEVPWIGTNDASPHNTYFKAHILYFSIDTLVSCASCFFDVLTIDTTSNLKVLFKAKKSPTALRLPDRLSVDALKKRIKEKGWIEYLFAGKGLLKPIRKIARSIEESRVNDLPGKKISDDILIKNINC